MRYSLLLIALASIACHEPGPRLREHTYPPSFEYIERSRLQSAMWDLAWEMKALDRTLRSPAGTPAEQQRQVGAILLRVDHALRGIATPGRVTQHPLLNRNLPRFRELVRRSRDDVARTPANYYSATALAGSCWACHGSAES